MQFIYYKNNKIIWKMKNPRGNQRKWKRFLLGRERSGINFWVELDEPSTKSTAYCFQLLRKSPRRKILLDCWRLCIAGCCGILKDNYRSKLCSLNYSSTLNTSESWKCCCKCCLTIKDILMRRALWFYFPVFWTR